MFGVSLVIALAVAVPSTNALGRLRDVPTGIPSVNAHELLGKWYRYASHVPCSWSGAGGFTDGVSTVSYDQMEPKYLTIVNTWRSSGICAERVEKVSKEGLECNKVISVNTLGGMASGTRIRVAIDYNDYDINWGCAKPSIDNPARCSDPMLSVFVRQPYPSNHTIMKIERELQRLFGISLNQMRLQQHTGQACN